MVLLELRSRLIRLGAVVLSLGVAFLICEQAMAGPVGAVGDVYVSDDWAGGLFQYDAETGELVGLFASRGTRPMQGHAWGPDGNLYAVVIGPRTGRSWTIEKFDGDTGEWLGTVFSRDISDGEGITFGKGIIFGPDGDLYFTDWFRQRLERREAWTMELKAVRVHVHEEHFGTPSYMIFGPNGNLWMVSSGYNRVLEFDTSGGGLELVGERGYWSGFAQPQDLKVGPNGDLFVSGGWTGNVGRFDGTTGEFIEEFIPSVNSRWVSGLFFDDYGRLLLSVGDDVDGWRVVAYDPYTGDELGDFYPPGGGGGGYDNSPVYINTKPPGPITLPLDIKPGSCPNPLNRGSHGLLPMAVLGTIEDDVANIDVSTVVILRSDGVGGAVKPHNSVYEDVGTPFDGEACDCHELGGDGITDLLLKFKNTDIVSGLELNGVNHGDVVELVVRGMLIDGGSFAAYDCIKTVGMNTHTIGQMESNGSSTGLPDAPAIPR